MVLSLSIWRSGANILKTGSNLDELEDFCLARSVKPSRNCISNVGSAALKKIDKGEWFDERANVKKNIEIKCEEGNKNEISEIGSGVIYSSTSCKI